MPKLTLRRTDRRPLAEFLHDELVGGLVLAAATVAALLWANVANGSYVDVWTSVPFPDAPFQLDFSLAHWVNDGLMTIFFFVAGLEIKRELVTGELARPRDAAIPLVAAFGGMLVPALIYTSLNAGEPSSAGWGVPIATDIAFVLGALALLGKRAPAGLRLFLLAVAIIDDIGGIIVIAIFYSEGLNGTALLIAAGAVLTVIGLRVLGAGHPLSYVLPGAVLWLALHESGIHATISGVILGLLTPVHPVRGWDVRDWLQDRIHPISAGLVIPLFALANAGVMVRPDMLSDALSSRAAIGVFLGLVIGKTIGVFSATMVAVKVGLGTLPAGLDSRDVLGGAALAGIGFTVALFIGELSLEGPVLAEVKLAILLAALAAAGLGWLILGSRHAVAHASILAADEALAVT